MKTSNKFLLSALVVSLVSLTLYNSALKAEFVTGNYKSPYARYENKNLKAFNEVQVNGTNLMDVIIRKGDYAAHLNSENTEDIKLTQVGKRLIVSVNFVNHPSADDARAEHYNQVIITCPQLVYVQTNEHEMRNQVPVDKNGYVYNGDNNTIAIRRFNLDSLNIQQNAGIIKIGKCNIEQLKATALAKSKLKIDEDTYINKADLHINDRSSLELEKFNIPHFNYTLADSATITLTSKGALLKDMINKL